MVTKEMMRGYALLNLARDVDFKILREQGKKITSLVFRVAVLDLFRNLIKRIPWYVVLERTTFSRFENGTSIPVSRPTSKDGKRPALMNND